MAKSQEVMKTKTWRVRQFRDEDKPGQLRLSALHFGDKDQAKEGYVDWLYGTNPAGRPIVVVAEDVHSGELIGFNSVVPVYASFQGRPRRCHMGCNQLIHPAHRGSGLFRAMQNWTFEAMTDTLCEYGFPKPMALGPMRSAGHFLTSPIPLLVRPLDITRLALARLANPVSRLAINVGWQIAGSTIWREPRSVGRSTGIRVGEEVAFDESFDDLWPRVANKYDIMVTRDSAFLNWRFRSVPYRLYRALSARVDGDLTGYTVLRCVDMEGVPTGLIMDLLVEPTARGEESGLLLVQEATRGFREAGMALAGCLMFRHTQEYAILRRAGYVDCPERLAPQAFIVSIRSLSPDAPNDILVQDDRWFMTMANHDAV